MDSINLSNLHTPVKQLEQCGFDKEALRRAAKALQPRISHKDEISRIISRLGLDVEGDIAKAWYALLDSAGKAHKRSFAQPLVVDDNFRTKYFQPFQTVVRAIVIELQKQYTSLVGRVDQIIAMPNKAEAVKIYASEIPGALALQWHFFKRIKTSDWLPHLIEEKLLGKPMPQYKEDKDNKLVMRISY